MRRQVRLPTTSPPRPKMLVGILILCLVAGYLILNIKLRKTQNMLAVVEESLVRSENIVVNIDSLIHLKKTTDHRILTLTSIENSSIPLSEFLSNIQKNVPEGVNFSEIEYSNNQFKVKGRTLNSAEIRFVKDWLTANSLLEPKLSYAKRNNAGEVEFEVTGQLPSTSQNVPKQKDTLSQTKG